MFSQFPKTRPPLPTNIAKIYKGYYKKNRTGGTPASRLAQWAESWLHKQVAADVALDCSPKTTLEIGAGTLNQLQFEPKIGPYDIVEPFEELYVGADERNRIRNIFADIGDLPMNLRYDRITSIATFEHICNLPEVIARAGLLLNEDGCLRASIPSEGTLLWRVGWELTTGIEFRIKYGLDFGALRRHEHVNTAREIEDLLDYFLLDIDRKILGISSGLSLYRFFTCQRPDRERCREYLDNY
jgi:hypothetical protein